MRLKGSFSFVATDKMFLTLRDKLDLLTETEDKVKNGDLQFNPDLVNFGFDHMEQLWPVYHDDIKGYPCVAYTRFSDVLKFGIKVIPMHIDFSEDKHPSKLETTLLKEFTGLVRSHVSPHITYYFTDFEVSNKKRAVTRFPLKMLRRDIHKTSQVLVAEYVTGGSIEEWIQEVTNITVAQWKYIIFAVAWTLLVLHDRYQFMHLDFHYGNVLIDTFINPEDNCVYKYTLTDADGVQHTWDVPNCGILPKLWDFEFANVYKGVENWYPNENWDGKEENVPTEFNPYYDLHYFLMSMLELEELPHSVRRFIESLYPPEVYPPMRDSESDYSRSSDSRRASGESASSRSKRSSDSSYDSTEDAERFYEYHYHTDEEDSCNGSTTTSDNESEDESSETSDNKRGRSRSQSGSRNSPRSSRSRSCSCSSCMKRKWIRTDYMLGDRLLNDTINKFDLPTPMDILSHEFFNEYHEGAEGTSILDFSYVLKPEPATEGTEMAAI